MAHRERDHRVRKRLRCCTGGLRGKRVLLLQPFQVSLVHQDLSLAALAWYSKTLRRDKELALDISRHLHASLNLCEHQLLVEQTLRGHSGAWGQRMYALARLAVDRARLNVIHFNMLEWRSGQ